MKNIAIIRKTLMIAVMILLFYSDLSKFLCAQVSNDNRPTSDKEIAEISIVLGGQTSLLPDSVKLLFDNSLSGMVKISGPLSVTIQLPSGRKHEMRSEGLILRQENGVITNITCFPGGFVKYLEVLDQLVKVYRTLDVRPELTIEQSIKGEQSCLGQKGPLSGYYSSYIEEKVLTEASSDSVIGREGSFLRFGFTLSHDAPERYVNAPEKRVGNLEWRDRTRKEYRTIFSQLPAEDCSVELFGGIKTLDGVRWKVTANGEPMAVTPVRSLDRNYRLHLKLPDGRVVDFLVRAAFLGHVNDNVMSVCLVDHSMHDDLSAAVDETAALLGKLGVEVSPEYKNTMRDWVAAGKIANYRLPFQYRLIAKSGGRPIRIDVELTRDTLAFSWKVSVAISADSSASQPTTRISTYIDAGRQRCIRVVLLSPRGGAESVSIQFPPLFAVT